jgi:hypothetical protein
MLKSFWVISNTMVELNHEMAEKVRTLQSILQIVLHFVLLNHNTVLVNPTSQKRPNK